MEPDIVERETSSFTRPECIDGPRSCITYICIIRCDYIAILIELGRVQLVTSLIRLASSSAPHVLRKGFSEFVGKVGNASRSHENRRRKEPGEHSPRIDASRPDAVVPSLTRCSSKLPSISQGVYCAARLVRQHNT